MLLGANPPALGNRNVGLGILESVFAEILRLLCLSTFVSMPRRMQNKLSTLQPNKTF